jgi:hypothetical protein
MQDVRKGFKLQDKKTSFGLRNEIQGKVQDARCKQRNKMQGKVQDGNTVMSD